MTTGVFATVSPLDIALITLAAFASAFVSGVAGFGGSFVLAIVLTPLAGPKAVVPLIAVYALCANIGRIWIYRHAIQWDFAIKFILASMPGMLLGAIFLKWVPENVLLALFGAVLLAVVPLRRGLEKADFAPGWKVIAGIGFVFGAISGTAVGSGMFVIATLNTFGLHGAELLGTDAVIGIVNAFARVVTFWWLGLLDTGLFAAGLLMGAVAIPATWSASLIVRRLGRKLHARLVEGIIVLAGISFILGAAL